ncbi:MAG: hypothetical protein ABR520_08840, partial [Mycobacteriales bacterium]
TSPTPSAGAESPSPSPSYLPDAPGRPARFIAVSAQHEAFLYDGATGQPLHPLGDDAQVVTTAAVDDGRTYYYASSSGCRSTIVGRESAGASPGATERSTESFRVERNGAAADLAASPDGRRLAYVLEVSRPGDRPGLCPLPELHVLDVTTGRDGIWTDRSYERDPAYPDSVGLSVRSLSWAPDSRHLAYMTWFCCDQTAGIRVLDTDAPGRDFLAPKMHGEFFKVGASSCRLLASTYRGRTGELAAVQECWGEEGETDASHEVVVVDPQTGRPTRTLAALSTADDVYEFHSLDFDRSGRHFLATWEERSDSGEQRVITVRWDGGEVHELTLGIAGSPQW